MRYLERIYGIRDELSISQSHPTRIIMRGNIACEHGLWMYVRKTITVREDGLISPSRYTYQANLNRKSAARSLFRYDNSHVQPGHHDAFHKHEFDGTITWIGIHDWPTLTDVIIEMHEWWDEIGKHIEWEGMEQHRPD